MKKSKVLNMVAFLLSGVIIMNSCLSATVFAADGIATVSGNDLIISESAPGPAVIVGEPVESEETVAESSEDAAESEDVVVESSEEIAESEEAVAKDSEAVVESSEEAAESGETVAESSEEAAEDESALDTVSGNDVAEDIELTQEFEGNLITMYGPASSFPEAEELSITVSAIDAQTAEVVEEAIVEEAEKLGKEVKSYQAFDIKLYADGEEVQPLGPVYVTFAKEVVEELLSAEPMDWTKNVAQAVAAAEVEAMEEQISMAPIGLEEVGAAEGEASSENIAVFHVDENTGAVQNMEAEVTAEGEVVMETDHFSVYVAVNLGPTSAGEVTLVVKHYANITYIPENLVADASVAYQDAKKSADTLSAVDEVYNKSTGTVTTETQLRKIYSDDSIDLPNGYSGLLKDLSKVYLADKSNKNYTIEGYYLLKKGGNPDNVNDYTRIGDNDTLEFTNAGDTKTILIKYTPVTAGTLEQAVLFFDYNYTDGYIYEADNVNGTKKKVSADNKGTQNAKKYIYAEMQGINSLIQSQPGNDGTKTVYTIGNKANGVVTNADENIYYDGSISYYPKTAATGKLTKTLNGVKYDVWNSINRISQGPQIMTKAGTKIYPYLTVAEGIIKELNGTKYQNVVAGDDILLLPDLFSAKPIEVNGSYYKMVYDDYRLVFSQNGETYTLSSVKDGNGNTVPTAKNLEKITNYKDSSYTNNFWPLDNVAYYDGKDPLLGQYLGNEIKNNSTRYYSNFGAIGKNDDDPLNANDDYSLLGEKTAHNWCFGMRYDFTFTIGDYEGPMNFYFRGDDDFWLFINGKLAIDIGGIHVAQGESLNIRDWIETTYANDPLKSDPDYPHQISIIYTERGGFGSCCYMQFTLPNVTPMNVNTSVEYKSYTANKVWDDTVNGFPEGTAYFDRPGSVEVQLQRKEGSNWVDLSDLTATLSPANNWTYTWNNLLKKDPSTGAEYEYRVKEVNVRADYDSTIDGGTITNTLKRTSITVVKSWDDKVWGDQDYAGRPASIEAVLYQNDSPYEEITLNASNGWTYTWNDLPQCDTSGKDYTYTVDEKAIPNGYSKKVEGYTITNTLKTTDVNVSKNWVNEDGVTNSKPDSIWVRLEQKIGSGDWAGVTNGGTKLPDVELKSDNGWAYTFTGLPEYDTASGVKIQYRIREVTGNNGTVIEAGTNVAGKNGWEYKVSYPDNTTITNTLQKTQLMLTKRIQITGADGRETTALDTENSTAIFRYLITGPNNYEADVTVNFEAGTVKVNGTTVVTDSDSDITNNIGFGQSGLSVTISDLQPGKYTVTEYAARGFKLVDFSTADKEKASVSTTEKNCADSKLAVTAEVDKVGKAYFWNKYDVPTDYTAVNRFSVDDLGKLEISVDRKDN